ncbi:MAG: CLC_0170 family protein [Clostridium sp.]
MIVLQFIEKFDLYLLILILVIGGLVFFVDAKFFKSEGNKTAYKQARYIGGGIMLLTFVLFLVRIIFII